MWHHFLQEIFGLIPYSGLPLVPGISCGSPLHEFPELKDRKVCKPRKGGEREGGGKGDNHPCWGNVNPMVLNDPLKYF